MKIKALQRRIKEWAIWLCAILAPLPWGGVGGGFLPWVGGGLLPWVGGGCLACGLLSACSESEGDEGEFSNWQARNEVYFASLADSLRANPDKWMRFKSYTLDEASEGKQTDYIYVKVVNAGDDADSPMFTDSVRVSYQGRLIPSATYPEGYVFDGTVYGQYSQTTNATARQSLQTMIDGYTTALLHMHRGDHWRVYIPSELAYGDNGNSSGSIPAYSVVIFDLTLIDFSPVGQVMPVWSSRRR